MCCVNHPAETIDTKLCVARVMHPEHGLMETVGYGTKVHNLRKHKANAMLLPIPADGRVGDIFIHDPKNTRGVLDRYVKAVWPPVPALRSNLIGSAVRYSARGEIRLEKVGPFHSLIADDPRDMPERLMDLPEDIRPEINTAIFEWFQKNYKGWKIALVCWINSAETDGLWYSYRPMDGINTLRAPAIDSHDGTAPDLTKEVYIDHRLFASWPEMLGGVEVNLDFVPEETRAFLPKRIAGADLRYRKMINGDFAITASQFKGAILPLDSIGRSLPPCAPRQVITSR